MVCQLSHNQSHQSDAEYRAAPVLKRYRAEQSSAYLTGCKSLSGAAP
jgi:hypothetical protein